MIIVVFARATRHLLGEQLLRLVGNAVCVVTCAIYSTGQIGAGPSTYCRGLFYCILKREPGREGRLTRCNAPKEPARNAAGR